jgi:hypothetical protein
MTDHVFGYVDGNMPSSIMNRNGMSNHLREDRTRPAPGADNGLFPTLVQIFNFFQ